MDPQRARALAVPTRVAVLEELRRATDPLTPQEMAAVLGVHHTAVRQHLVVLEAVGLVAPVPLPPQGRGRPRIAYRALTDPEPYQHLAVALADAVGGHRTAREAGHLHGAKVPPSSLGPVETLRAETERLGFRPTVRARGAGRWELVLHACPFADVAAVNPDVVCDLHMGLAEGLLSVAGGVTVADLRVADPHRGGCRFTLVAT